MNLILVAVVSGLLGAFVTKIPRIGNFLFQAGFVLVFAGYNFLRQAITALPAYTPLIYAAVGGFIIGYWSYKTLQFIGVSLP